MSFFEELKRRNVVKAAVAYTIVAWLLLQVAATVFPVFETPSWVMPIFTVLLALGFPLVLIFAWAFELTPDGIRRESESIESEPADHSGGRRLDFIIIGLLVVAVIFLVTDNYIIDDELPDTLPRSEEVVRSIAVLPFKNRSALPEDAFFVDGIHDDILTRLATVSSFDKIISRTSVERYRDTDKQMPQIAHELDVTTIIEGGVQRSGDRVRINVQLIEATTDDHQWAATYERELTAENVFAIQAEVAAAIVGEMEATLSPRERDSLNSVPTNNMEALEHYFRGRDQMRRRTSIAMRSAIEHLQTAVELDSNFVLAHASLAEAYILWLTFAGDMPREERIARAREHATRTLALDPESSEAYSTLGNLESRINPVAAESAYRKAIALNPNNYYAHYNYCWLLHLELGRNNEALERCKKALELDPFSPIVVTTTGTVLWALGRPEEARVNYEEAVEIDPDFVVSRAMWSLLDWNHYARLDAAAKRLRVAFSLDAGNVHISSFLAELYLDLGDPDRAAFWFEKHQEMFPDSQRSPQLEALMLAHKGEHAKAVELARSHFEPQQSDSAWTLRFLRDDALQQGRYGDVREMYEGMYPEFLDDSLSKLTATNFFPAIDLAFVLYRSGEQQQADKLISLAKEHMQTTYRNSPHNSYGIADVLIFAMQEDTINALASLREAIDEGWRYQWWLDLKHHLVLQPLHGEPAFQEMVQDIETEMAAQLENVREMEANGELAEIPE